MIGLGIISQATAVKDLVEHGDSANLVPIFTLSARTIQVIAGLGLAFGIYPRASAVALMIFLIPATFIAHDFSRSHRHSLYAAVVQFSQEHSHGGWLAVYRKPRNPNQRCFRALHDQTVRINEKESIFLPIRPCGLIVLTIGVPYAVRLLLSNVDRISNMSHGARAGLRRITGWPQSPTGD